MMMEPPIYRAKRLDNGEYIEGYYTYEKAIRNCDGTVAGRILREEKHFIQDTVCEQWYETDPSTLSISFDGMVDKNGKKIFASLSEDGKGGDIVYAQETSSISDLTNDVFRDVICVFYKHCMTFMRNVQNEPWYFERNYFTSLKIKGIKDD